MKKRRSGSKAVVPVIVALVIAAGLATATGRPFDILGVHVPLPHMSAAVPAPKTVTSSTPAPPASSATAPTSLPPTTTGEYALVQEPQAGFGFIYGLFDSAKSSIDMTMYELVDATAVQHLVAARGRGVAVRVLLDKAYHGQKANQAAFDALTAARVSVRWAAPGVIFHQKTITIDSKLSVVGTANLTAKYYAGTRDAWVIDRNPAQVAAIEQTFTADLRSPSRPGTATQTQGLVWSPGAEDEFVNTINTATKTVKFQSEELKDTRVVTALAAAADRGVTCDILMTRDAAWYPAYKTVTAAGCSVHLSPHSTRSLYIHEKTVLADSDNIIIGSQNAGLFSLTRNRELSLHLTSTDAKTLIGAVESTYVGDFAAAGAWHE